MIFLASKSNRLVLVSLICDDLSFSSGACARSNQIVEILQDAGWSLEPIAPVLPPVTPLVTALYGLGAVCRDGLLHPLGLASLRSQGHSNRAVVALCRRFPSLCAVVIEGTGFGALASLSVWRRRGVKTVLIPANIESLAPNSHAWTHRGRDVAMRFADERVWWSIADSIFTISNEEAWWLELHGIKAAHLPYYPDSRRLQALQVVRRDRKPSSRVGWLWLADFNNPANRAGVPLTLEWLRNSSSTPSRVTVVGRGAEWLFENFADQLPHFIHLAGSIDDAELQLLYRTCTAQLIVHPATSGMLTRVVDAAIAGIPVVGNDMALKSYALCFHSADSIHAPPPPAAAVVRFLAELDS